ncbi:hypothetical protein Are01nite_48720 [Actinoplanes regularis]|nr:hypothetical protein Are01nite_48720 [Actinoplanes regularis]
MTAATSKNSMRSHSSRRSNDLQAGGGRGRTVAGGLADGTGGLRAHHEFVQLTHRVRPDLLGEVGGAGREDPGDLRIVGHHRMAAHHQIERPGLERQRIVLGRLHHDSAERREPFPREGGVRRPPLGRHELVHRRSSTSAGGSSSGTGGGQDLSAAGLQVEDPPSVGHPRTHQPGVTPTRPLLGRPSREPGEIPPLDRRGPPLGDKILEGTHGLILVRRLTTVKRLCGRTGTA